jgi:hypothetical protein
MCTSFEVEIEEDNRCDRQVVSNVMNAVFVDSKEFSETIRFLDRMEVLRIEQRGVQEWGELDGSDGRSECVRP